MEQVQLTANEKLELKDQIVAKLREFGAYIDDELPEYIGVLVANNRTKDHILQDMKLFLNDSADEFTNWLEESVLAFRRRRVDAEAAAKARDDDEVSMTLEDGDEFEAEPAVAAPAPARAAPSLAASGSRSGSGTRLTSLVIPASSDEDEEDGHARGYGEDQRGPYSRRDGGSRGERRDGRGGFDGGMRRRPDMRRGMRSDWDDRGGPDRRFRGGHDTRDYHNRDRSRDRGFGLDRSRARDRGRGDRGDVASRLGHSRSRSPPRRSSRRDSRGSMDTRSARLLLRAVQESKNSTDDNEQGAAEDDGDDDGADAGGDVPRATSVHSRLGTSAKQRKSKRKVFAPAAPAEPEPKPKPAQPAPAPAEEEAGEGEGGGAATKGSIFERLGPRKRAKQDFVDVLPSAAGPTTVIIQQIPAPSPPTYSNKFGYSNAYRAPSYRTKPVPIKHNGTMCKFFPWCTNRACPFFHPKKCKYWNRCYKVGCPFAHGPGRVLPSNRPAPPKKAVSPAAGAVKAAGAAPAAAAPAATAAKASNEG